MFLIPSVPFNDQKPIWMNADFKYRQELLKAKIANISLTQVRGKPTVNSQSLWGANDAYWEFDYEWDSTGNMGLIVRDAVIRNNSRSLSQTPTPSTEKIFKAISFLNVKVHFKDPNGANAHSKLFKFNPSKDTEALVEYRHSGYLDQPQQKINYKGANHLDYSFAKVPKIQHLIHSCHYNFYKKVINSKVTKLISVCCRQSIAFCSEGTDFDPGETQVVMKIFPQISFTWHEKPMSYLKTAEKYYDVQTLGANESIQIDSFTAAVRCVENLKSEHSGCCEINSPEADHNFVSLYTDANDIKQGRYRESTSDFNTLTPPLWHYLFSYTNTNLAKEAKYIGVGLDPAFDPANEFASIKTDNRSKDYWYPRRINNSSMAYTFFEKKRKRQGAYDNIHVTGIMLDSIFGDPAAHAPFCGRTCLHSHWRWGILANFLRYPPMPDTVKLGAGFHRAWAVSGSKTNKFHGWGKNAQGKWESMNSNIDSLGLPLIPPNQALWIAITNADKNVSQVLNMPNNSLGSDTLSNTEKVVWYMHKITKPPMTNRQVIMENGLGYALEYNNDKFTLGGMASLMDGDGLSSSSQSSGGFDDVDNQLDQMEDKGFITDPERDTKKSRVNVLMDDMESETTDYDKIHEFFMFFYDFIRYNYSDNYIGTEQVPPGTLTDAKSSPNTSLENL